MLRHLYLQGYFSKYDMSVNCHWYSRVGNFNASCTPGLRTGGEKVSPKRLTVLRGARTAISLVATILFVGLAPRVSAVPQPGDNLIVPGQRIGPIIFGMDPIQVTNILGKGTVSRPPGCSNNCAYYYDYANLGLSVQFSSPNNPKVVGIIATGSQGRWATAEGIRVGSSTSSVEDTYGKPSSQYCGTTKCILYYHGIIFYGVVGGKLYSIAVNEVN